MDKSAAGLKPNWLYDESHCNISYKALGLKPAQSEEVSRVCCHIRVTDAHSYFNLNLVL